MRPWIAADVETLRLGALVVAAGVSGVVLGVVGVEELGPDRRGQSLEAVAGVPDQPTVRVTDGDRASAEGLQLRDLPGLVPRRGGGDVQPAEVLVLLEAVGVGEDRWVEHDGVVLDPHLLGEAVPVTCVSLVRGDEVGRLPGGVRRDRVRQVHPLDRPGADLRAAVVIGRVEPLAWAGVVLQTQRQQLLHLGRPDVHDCDGVVLLEGHIGGLALAVHGDVLRLEVLRGAGARPEDPDAGLAQGGLLPVVLRERGGAGGGPAPRPCAGRSRTRCPAGRSGRRSSPPARPRWRRAPSCRHR